HVVGMIAEYKAQSDARCSIARALHRQGQPERALEIAQSALDAAAKVEPDYTCAEVKMRVARCLRDLDAQPLAITVAHDVLSRPYSVYDPTYGPDALKEVFRILAAANDRAGIERALAVAEGISDNTFRADAIREALEALVKVGLYERAFEAIEANS